MVYFGVAGMYGTIKGTGYLVAGVVGYALTNPQGFNAFITATFGGSGELPNSIEGAIGTLIHELFDDVTYEDLFD